MSSISDSQRLMFLVLSFVSPCELETEEGIRLQAERSKKAGACPQVCPFHWYCHLIAAATLHSTRDFVELATKKYVPLENVEPECVEAIQLIIKAYSKRPNHQ